MEADLEPGYRLVPRRYSAINAGLRALGVRAEAGLDEYETAGLTRHRSAEDWLTEPPGAASLRYRRPGARGLQGRNAVRTGAGRTRPWQRQQASIRPWKRPATRIRGGQIAGVAS